MAKVTALPLGIFLKQFPIEAQCQEYLASLRWRLGYVCPKCGYWHGYRLSNEAVPVCPVPTSALNDGGDGATQDPYAADPVVLGILSGVPG
ncbi:MAG: transposase [Clostridiales bacterium]|nr:transposase [Clostridiales bacterium]